MKYPPILAAAALVLGAAPAFADTVAVKVSDLNLSTAAGQAQLERRIDSAARSICGIDEVRTGSRLASTEARRCYQETRANVHDQVAAAIARDNSRG